MARQRLVHTMKRQITVPSRGEPYWETACGIRLADKTEMVTTSDDPKQVTCGKCK